MISVMFKQVDIQAAMSNPIGQIGSDWMLVTSGSVSKFNMMTASWGAAGFMWNKPVVFVFIRTNRFTFEFMENNPSFTVSFFNADKKKILSFCGSHSGRDVDKASACGLTAFQTPCGSVAFEESKLYFECRKMYAQQMHASSFIDKEALDKWYSKDPMHKMYVAEILGAYSAH